MFDQFECVEVELYDGIAYVRMNRPQKRNAMNPQLHDEMEEALTDLEVHPDAKVIVICGAGGNFSAGQDLKMFFRENENNPLGRKNPSEQQTAGGGNFCTIMISQLSRWSKATASVGLSCNCWRQILP